MTSLVSKPSETTKEPQDKERQEEASSLDTASGDLTESTDSWKCPDPGCKKVNVKSSKCCIQCQLPRNSAQQFKKGHKKDAGRSNHQHYHYHSKKGSKVSDEYADKPIVQLFQNLSQELDERHDKYERIVKLCRDITIESKRIIFHLHRIQKVENEIQILDEVEGRLSKIQSSLWIQVAKELNGECPFQYLRAYTGGLQEYIEAKSFYHFLRYNELISLSKVQEELIFESEKEEEDIGENKDKFVSPLLVTIPKTDFILGIADLSGEIMRRVINSIGFGDTESCFKLTEFLHRLYYGFKIFEGLTAENRELRSKSYTMLNSLKKCEAACYTINLRGSEIPKHMFAEILSKNEHDEVESVKNTMDISAYYDDE